MNPRKNAEGPRASLSRTLRPIYDLEIALGNEVMRVDEPAGTRSPLCVVFRDRLHFGEIERRLTLSEGVERWENRDVREAPEAGFVCAATRHALSGPLSCVAVRRSDDQTSAPLTSSAAPSPPSRAAPSRRDRPLTREEAEAAAEGAMRGMRSRSSGTLGLALVDRRETERSWIFVADDPQGSVIGVPPIVVDKLTGEIRFVQEAVMEFGPPKMRLSLATRLRRWWARRYLY